MVVLKIIIIIKVDKIRRYVEVIVDRNLGNLSFCVNGIDYWLAAKELPKEDILYPIVIMHDQNKSIEIMI